MADESLLRSALARWAMDDARIVPHTQMQGSPERSLFRTVVADAAGSRFILEQLASKALDLKTGIAFRIARLAEKGLAVAPYRKGTDGQWIQQCGGFCWQLAPYIEGQTLDRETYWQETWRGEAAGRFLAQLRTVSHDWPAESPVFSLPAYIEDLVGRIRRYNPEVLPAVDPLAAFLKREFYPVVDDVSKGFCHGDPHPLNMIWAANGIAAVIDWEFCGWKPILYDAALIVGCVGAEAAEARNHGFICGFMKTLEEDKAYSPKQLALLPLFVLAVRFGWLSEWLRKRDREMIAFELFYMGLLMDNCRAGQIPG